MKNTLKISFIASSLALHLLLLGCNSGPYAKEKNKADAKRIIDAFEAGQAWSSKTVKKDIERMDSFGEEKMANAIESMTLYRFRYDQNKLPNADDREYVGPITEELPEQLVIDGRMLSMYDLLTYSIAAIKQQQREINKLKQSLPEEK